MKPSALVPVTLCLAACGPSARKPAEIDALEGRRIFSRELVSKEPIPVGRRTRILGLMETKIGLPYHQETLDEDIKALYASGEVDDIEFVAETHGDGVKVIATIDPRPLLR